MKFELVIDSKKSEVIIALLKEGRLIELHKEQRNNDYCVGDIYLGKVRKIVPGLNASFVNVGYEKDGFLHYLDLGSQINSFKKFTEKTLAKKLNTASLKNFKKEKDTNKEGDIKNVLKGGDQILVQVTKEPISSKGPRLSTELSIAGRYMVLLPFSERVSISQKIKSRTERSRLKNLIQSIKPEGFGVIIRTVAEKKKVADLDKDLKNLYRKWQSIYKNTKISKPKTRVHSELRRTSAIIRDLLTSEFNKIHVNDADMYNEIKEYLARISPNQENIVKLYKSEIPIFQKMEVTQQIKSSFGKTANMKNGTYLVIEHTEALHVIDVNSGKKVDSNKDQEENALLVNLIAVEEVSRQLRLRDMGGIIIVDFIDQKNAKNRKIIYEKMVEYMKSDKAKHHILPLTKFGLMQITRQRVRPEMNIDTMESCPMCAGKGKIDSSLILIETIENKILEISKKKKGIIKIATHPFIASHINKGWFFSSIRHKWARQYGRKIIIKGDERLHLLQYSIVK
ncbi:MAG: ribonuclease E/G [Flavobacteriales bacterium]|nr:ribonuclease E/G [Flavobacteriales bacterium]|tara:strand:- start:716 stop:2245 length:1530 start_codon:yes stop_codon:yes gene_type:complete